MRKYTADHEWLDLDGDIATVGITDYAQKALGDVVFIELPAVGKTVSAGDEAAVVESVKAASEVYAPAAGTILEVNDALEDAPDTVNSSPEADGWFFKLQLSDPSAAEALMDADAYAAHVAGLED
ncbi:MAG: glycine cleavage system protein GcvH [Sphingomonadales bacterium]